DSFRGADRGCHLGGARDHCCSHRSGGLGRVYLPGSGYGEQSGHSGGGGSRRNSGAVSGYQPRMARAAAATTVKNEEESMKSDRHSRRRHAQRAWPFVGKSLGSGWGSLLILVVGALLSSCSPARSDLIVIGSKNFTESLILGELIAQQIEAQTSLKVERRFYLAGTYICHQAVLAGRIDMYPEYTGTALSAILKRKPEGSRAEVYQQVKDEYEKRLGLTLGPSFGFNDTFAMEIRGDDARRLNIRTLSQAAAYAPQWRAGFGYEFMERPDGYKGLAAAYGLHFAAQPRVMDLGLLARALRDHQIDLAAGNATDGLI